MSRGCLACESSTRAWCIQPGRCAPRRAPGAPSRRVSSRFCQGATAGGGKAPPVPGSGYSRGYGRGVSRRVSRSVCSERPAATSHCRNIILAWSLVRSALNCAVSYEQISRGKTNSNCEVLRRSMRVGVALLSWSTVDGPSLASQDRELGPGDGGSLCKKDSTTASGRVEARVAVVARDVGMPLWPRSLHDSETERVGRLRAPARPAWVHQCSEAIGAPTCCQEHQGPTRARLHAFRSTADRLHCCVCSSPDAVSRVGPTSSGGPRSDHHACDGWRGHRSDRCSTDPEYSPQQCWCPIEVAR